MKKILSLILALTMLCGMLTVGVGAEASASDVIDALDYVMNDYLWLAEWCGGYYPIDGAPSAYAVDMCFKWTVEGEYSEYMISMDEYGFSKYEVPAEVYENEIVSTSFAMTDALIEKLHAADFYKTDKDEPYYFIEVGGGFGGPLPTIVTQGFTKNHDGLYIAYSYFVETFTYDDEWNEIPYVPAEGDIEGKDYIYILSEGYSYDSETDSFISTAAYVPAKITSGHKATVELDVDNWTSVYHSYEKMDASLVPSAEEMTVRDSDAGVAYVGGAFMEMDRTTFDEGTVVYGSELYDDPESEDDVFDKMADHTRYRGEICGIYEFKAMKDGVETQPIDGVNVSFVLPYDFSPECFVLLIEDDGTVVHYYTQVDADPSDPTVLYATLDMRCMGRYAVVGCRYGDVNKDSNVGLLDVSIMLKKVAGWDMGDLGSPADADRDGNVNLIDVSRILKYIAEWDVVFGENYKPAEPGPAPDPFPEEDPIPVYKEFEIDENGVLLKYNGDDNVVTIPNGVTAVGAEVFKGKSMSYVYMPDSLTEIGEGAFMNCKNLFEINFSKNLKAIPKNAFLGSTVEYVEIPDSVTSIGAGAFAECYWIEDVIIPDSVTFIEEGAFDGFGESPYLIFHCSEGSAADEYSMKHKITCDLSYFN